MLSSVQNLSFSAGGAIGMRKEPKNIMNGDFFNMSYNIRPEGLEINDRLNDNTSYMCVHRNPETGRIVAVPTTEFKYPVNNKVDNRSSSEKEYSISPVGWLG